WHGANWTFLIWGGYHGLLLAFERMGGKGMPNALPLVLRRTITLVLVMIGWVFFRAPSLDAAGSVFAGMAGLYGVGVLNSFSHPVLPCLLLATACVIAWCMPNTWEMRHLARWWQIPVLLALFGVSIAVMLVNTSSPFLYFQF
ncbi:MAG: MBOAT family protein, partial [Kiritimatiellae bacterium]|nr:MBOAT family protein [Kiritimatiellia bacterium]